MLLCTALTTPLGAQLEDNVWVFGYRYTDQALANGIYFNFGDSLTINYSPKPMSLSDSYASICDSSGVLLLLSNGCYIETGAGEYIENSYGLNPGYLSGVHCYDDSSGYNIPQNMLMLAEPGSSTKFHLFHIRHSFDGQTAFLDDLLHTVVDMSVNNGEGMTIYKNQVLINDSIDGDGIHAVRHANGRDWWVVVAKYLSNTYYTILFTPEGITIQKQIIGLPNPTGAFGEMLFSPDGTKLARFNAKDDLRIFDFDRCTGILSNPLYIPIEDDADNSIIAGLAFSADGRYLYAAEVRRLLQFDMLAPDIAISKTIVAERIINPDCSLGSSIGFLELGPDGRIYCRPGSGQSCMHRLARPELPGAAADFIQYYYMLDFSYDNLPHFPNFRLGPVDGSPCDTLGIDNHPLAGWRYDRTGGLGVDFTSVSWYEPTEWLWDFGDPASGGANGSAERNPSHAFSAPGAYPVCLTVSNQYGSDEKCKTVWVSTTGSSSPQSAAEVRIYPNPTKGEVRWSGLPVGEEVRVRVSNSVGTTVLEQKTSEQSIELHQLLPGLYYLQLQSNSSRILTAKVLLLKE